MNTSATTLTKKAPSPAFITGSAEWAESKLEKFLSKDFKYLYEGRELSFKAIKFTQFGLIVKSQLARLVGDKLISYNVAEKDGWDRFHDCFGHSNKSPRQSILNLFTQANLTLYIRERKGKPVQIILGSWAKNLFYGVVISLL